MVLLLIILFHGIMQLILFMLISLLEQDLVRLQIINLIELIKIVLVKICIYFY